MKAKLQRIVKGTQRNANCEHSESKNMRITLRITR